MLSGNQDATRGEGRIVEDAWLFPGQGSQHGRMAASLPASAELFARARSHLGIDLDGSTLPGRSSLWDPVLLQLAMFITCVAAARKLSDEGQAPRAVCGHSLGEFAAVVAARCLSFEDGLVVVHERAKAMVGAARRADGGMAAVVGAGQREVEETCVACRGRGGEVWSANFNGPTQTVVSGTELGLRMIAQYLRTRFRARVIRLEVPVPAHCPLMSAARDAMASAVSRVDVRPPEVAFYSPLDGARHDRSDEIAEILIESAARPVRFEQTIATMSSEGISSFLEVGPGNVLMCLIRKLGFAARSMEPASTSRSQREDASRAPDQEAGKVVVGSQEADRIKVPGPVGASEVAVR